MQNNHLYEAAEEAKKVKFLYEVSLGYTLSAKLERFFGIALLLALLNLLFIAWRPEWAFWSSLTTLFLIGAWLPHSYLVNRLEDLAGYRDVLILALLHGLLGNPVAAFAVYGVLALLFWLLSRGEQSNPAALFALIYLGFRCLFDAASILSGTVDSADWLRFGIDFMSSLPFLAMSSGWFVGSLFRDD
ncbi:MAG: hypothetical protein K6U12_11715 [Armatimonadetes bacterium]|nr:hypothetical protein [Armatimonadota bacterium]CUU36023.1 hypothetical protein DCOP10_116178 [Armatimonadetes bacterium DC]